MQRVCRTCKRDLDPLQHGGHFCSFSCVDAWANGPSLTPYIRREMERADIPLEDEADEADEVEIAFRAASGLS